MRAAVYHRYGPPEVVAVEEVPTPVPGRGELLVRVRATAVTSADHRLRSLDLPPGFGPLGRLAFGLTGPRQPILGQDLAGEVAAIGPGATGFKEGDAVLGSTGVRMGCHAEYACVRADGPVVALPRRLAFEEAVSFPFGGLTALHFLRKARLRPGERVLVNGAAGAVGSACVQLARHMGAEVTAVCSGGNAELLRGLGATRVIDREREDFAASGQTWDAIVDAVGNAPMARCRPALAPGGRLALVVASAAATFGAPLAFPGGGRKVIVGVTGAPRADLQRLVDLASEGVLRPVVDSRFALDRIADAHRRVDGGRKRGTVVVAPG